MMIPNASSCTHLLTQSFFIVSICCLFKLGSGARYICHFRGLLECPTHPLAKLGRPTASCNEPPTNLKVMVGSRQATRTTACAAGAAKAGSAATGVLDDDERAPVAPPGGSAGAGAAETSVLEDGERAPFGCSAEAGAASPRRRGCSMTATRWRERGARNPEAQPRPALRRWGARDGEHSAMSRELVAKRQRKLNHVTGTVGSSVAS